MKKFFTLLVLFISLNKLSAQCAANFVYTLNPAGNVTFSNTSTFTGTNVSYFWDFGDNQSSTLINPSHTYAGNGIYIVSLTIMDSIVNNICINTHTQAITITNTACLVNANMSNYQSSNYVVQFSNLSAGVLPSTSYTLNFGDNSSATFVNLLSTSHSYSASGSYSYTLIVENIPSCTSTYSALINIVTQTCALSANFSFNIAAGSVTFANTSVGTSSSTTYLWDFDNTNQSAVQSPPPQTYNYNGTYTVTLTIQDSVNFICSSTITKILAITSASCYVGTSFTMAKDSSFTSSIVWDAYPVYPLGVTSVTWTWGDNSSSNTMYPSHTYSAAAIYTICLTVSVACGSQTTICMNPLINKGTGSSAIAIVNVKNAPTGIKNEKKDVLDNFRIHPNPSTGAFSVEISGMENQSIIIFNQLGQQVYETKIINRPNTDISIDLPNGIYFVQLNSSGGMQIKKIIINK